MKDQMLQITALKKLLFSFWLLLDAFAVQGGLNAHKMNYINLWLCHIASSWGVATSSTNEDSPYSP